MCCRVKTARCWPHGFELLPAMEQRRHLLVGLHLGTEVLKSLDAAVLEAWATLSSSLNAFALPEFSHSDLHPARDLAVAEQRDPALAAGGQGVHQAFPRLGLVAGHLGALFIVGAEWGVSEAQLTLQSRLTTAVFYSRRRLRLHSCYLTLTMADKTELTMPRATHPCTHTKHSTASAALDEDAHVVACIAAITQVNAIMAAESMGAGLPMPDHAYTEAIPARPVIGSDPLRRVE